MAQTLAQLRDLQRLAGAVIMRPLDRDWRTQRHWIDRRLTRDVVGGFIKPNDRLTSLERIEIYNRQYWFRLIDCMHDDYPGLRAVLGRNRFNRLIKAYIAAHPSRCFTLRNLSTSLLDFMPRHRNLVGPRYKLAMDMARFEWAQIVAFDGPAKKSLGVDDLLGKDPTKLRVSLQPYLTILDLAYPLDDYSRQLKQDALRGQASNAMADKSRGNGAMPARRRRSLPGPKRVFIVVHRHDNQLYYKRLETPAYRILRSLESGLTVAQSLVAAREKLDVQWVRQSFQTWSALGWFCRRSSGGAA